MDSQHCVYYISFCKGQGEEKDVNCIGLEGKKDQLERTDLGSASDGLPGPSIFTAM